MHNKAYPPYCAYFLSIYHIHRKVSPIISKTKSTQKFSIIHHPPPLGERNLLLLKKQSSDPSHQTSNPTHYRNKFPQPSTHPTAFEGVCFFKSNKFFLSAPTQKNKSKKTKKSPKFPPLLTKFSPKQTIFPKPLSKSLKMLYNKIKFVYLRRKRMNKKWEFYEKNEEKIKEIQKEFRTK